ncbi:guanylin [Sphaerodactylus townsendi]|uniref:guanylin n=1 Tax=Sphaerodactylus townsendi TaxID=933632 RepID=UPI00202652E5|nr:guanylin [Sphaerodactylus townsendi]
MNAFLTVSLCLCALAALSDAVTVKVGDFSFPLESVKKLKDLLNAHHARSPRHVVTVCDDPDLPTEFQLICASPNSEALLKQLEAIARNSEVCEICANVACSGC